MEVIVATPELLRLILREELELFRQFNPLQALPQHEAGKTIFNLDQFCEYTGLSKQSAYKLTGKGLVPHSKRGKRLYFDKAEIDAWLLQNRVGNVSETESKADEYLMKNRRRRV